MLFLLLLVLYFVLEENLYGTVSLRNLCLLLVWHINVSILESQCLLGASVFFWSLEHQLKAIFKSCTTWAYIFVQQDTGVKLISNDTVVESNLCECDRALVDQLFLFSFKISLLRNVFPQQVSEPQSINTLVSMKVCPFDSFTGIMVRKHDLDQVVYLLLLHYFEVARVFGRLVQ